MKRIFIEMIKSNRYFLFPVLLFYLFSLYRMLVYSKIDNHLFFNQYVGNFYLDNFFRYITHIGDGLFLVIFAFFWLLKNIRQSFILLLTYVLVGGGTSILKNYIFDVKRPHFVFDYYYKDIPVKYVDGVELLGLNSFPSGHSATAFVLCTFLSLYLFRQNTQKFGIALAGIVITYSRLYLSLHWLEDIVVGSAIGIVFMMLMYLIMERNQFLRKYDTSLIKLIKKQISK